MRTQVMTSIDDFTLGIWSTKDQAWYQLDEIDNKEVAKMLDCSPELIDFFRMNFEDFVMQLKKDLVDLYNR